MNVKTMTAPEYAFVRWLSDKHPALLNAAEANMQRAGMGALTDSINSLFSTVNRGLETYVKGKQAIALVKINVSRAKQGLPPIEADGGIYAISDRDMQQRPEIGGLPLIAWVAIGLGAFFLLRR